MDEVLDPRSMKQGQIFWLGEEGEEEGYEFECWTVIGDDLYVIALPFDEEDERDMSEDDLVFFLWSVDGENGILSELELEDECYGTLKTYWQQWVKRRAIVTGDHELRRDGASPNLYTIETPDEGTILLRVVSLDVRHRRRTYAVLIGTYAEGDDTYERYHIYEYRNGKDGERFLNVPKNETAGAVLNLVQREEETETVDENVA